jgi:hypothetical protein
MLVLTKIAALLLATVYLFSATATSEFLKMPVLVQHFCDHKEENKNTRLITFLVQHYFSEDGTDKDAAEDNQLPFKSTDQVVSFMFNCLTPPSFIQLSAGYSTQIKNRFYIRNQFFHPAEYLSAVWQPPRYC